MARAEIPQITFSPPRVAFPPSQSLSALFTPSTLVCALFEKKCHFRQQELTSRFHSRSLLGGQIIVLHLVVHRCANLEDFEAGSRVHNELNLVESAFEFAQETRDDSDGRDVNGMNELHVAYKRIRIESEFPFSNGRFHHFLANESKSTVSLLELGLQGMSEAAERLNERAHQSFGHHRGPDTSV